MPTLHPRSTRPVLHTRAGPAGPELRLGPHPARSQAPSASSHRQGGSSRVVAFFFFLFQKLRAWAAQTPEFMIHGYITAGCHARGTRILGLPLFTILAHLTCFLPVFPSGPVSCLISTSRPASIPATTASTTTTTTTNADGPKSSSEHLASNSLKQEERGISHILSHHISHIQDVRPIEESERLTDHHKIEASIHSRDTGLGRLQASTLHCFPPPTLQRLLRSEPSGPFGKVGNNPKAQLHAHMSTGC